MQPTGADGTPYPGAVWPTTAFRPWPYPRRDAATGHAESLEIRELDRSTREGQATLMRLRPACLEE